MTLRVHSCGGEAVGATLATLQSSFFSSFFFLYERSFNMMCKSSQENSDNGQEKVENSNYGLVNFSDSSMGRLDLGEILIIILLGLAVIMLVWYFCKKKRQRRLCDLREAVAY